MISCKRDLYSLPRDQHYLNCAYMSPLSKRVEAAGLAGIRRKAAPADITPDDFFKGPDAVRRLFAELIGVSDPERIAIVPSVSYGISTFARNTMVSQGQNVVTLLDQFPSHVYPWRRLCRETGAELKVVIPASPGSGRAESWNSALLEAIDADTAVVAVPNVHWTDGTRFDSSIPKGKPAEFFMSRVVAGWTDGLQTMVEGEIKRFWIPEELAYKGKAGRPAGMLIFEVELVKIK